MKSLKHHFQVTCKSLLRDLKVSSGVFPFCGSPFAGEGGWTGGAVTGWADRRRGVGRLTLGKVGPLGASHRKGLGVRTGRCKGVGLWTGCRYRYRDRLVGMCLCWYRYTLYGMR